MRYEAPSAPLTFGDALEDWLCIFRASLRYCWPLPVILAVVMEWAELSTVGHARGPQTPYDTLPDLLFLGVMLIVLGGLVALQSTMARSDEAPSPGKALSEGFRRLPRVALAALLFALIVVPLLVAMALGQRMLGGLSVPGSGSTPGLALGAARPAVFIGLGGLATYLWVRLGMWLPAIITEDYGAVAAFGRSWRLVKGNWWRVFGIAIVAAIVMLIFGTLVGAPIGVFALRSGVRAVVIGGYFLNNLLQCVLILPMTTAIWLAVYNDLRLRHADVIEQ